MRSAAAQIEEIQTKLQLLRQEREKEQKVFDEIAASNKDWSAAEIAEVARKKAAEDEPKSIQVNGSTVSVGDYVHTLDDFQVLLAAESGILLPDPVKKVYLGERGRITRVIPSFQGKSAVEMCFADGATKIFLTDCLATRNYPKKTRKPLTQSANEKASIHLDACVQRAPEYVPPPVPDPLPQPSWSTIGMLGRDRKGKLQKLPIHSTEAKKKGSTVPFDASMATPPETSKSSSEGLGLVKEVMLNEQQRFSKVLLGERLGSPLSEGISHHAAIVSRVEHDNLLKTPRPDLMAYTFPWRKTHSPLRDYDDSDKIPKSCPPSYRAKFSMVDISTKVPRLHEKKACLKQFFVAGVLSEGAGLHFQSVMLDTNSTLQSVLLALTEELRWGSAGLRASRLFTLDGLEVVGLSDLMEGISLVVTTGFVYISNSIQKPKVISDAAHNSNNPPSAMTTTTTTTTTRKKIPESITSASESSTAAHKPLVSNDHAPMGSAKNRAGPLKQSVGGTVETGTKDASKSTTGKAMLTGKKQLTRETPRNTISGRVLGTGGVLQGDLTCKEVPEESTRSDVVISKRSSSVTQKSSQGSMNMAREPTVVVSTTSVEKNTYPIRTTVSSGIRKTGPPSRTEGSMVSQEAVSVFRRTGLTKGITKTINVRVFSNGEYGDKHTDRFPFRTVTLRPIHKTLKSVFNTIERNLEWHSCSKKIDVLYDASGCEILSLDGLYDGQAIVASCGDKFVVPRPHTMLYEESMK